MDEEKAVFWWRKAAEQGSAEAQNELGGAYAEGHGTRRDRKQAVEWYRKAADQGLAVAQANLGTMYRDGTGVRRNDKLAVEWYRKAAAQQLGWAQFFLGEAYSLGRGVQRDPIQATAWYLLAARQDYTEAQYKRGMLYQKSAPVPGRTGKSREDYAQYWLGRAAESGHEGADRNLAAMLGPVRSRRLPAGIAIREAPALDAAVVRETSLNEIGFLLPLPDRKAGLQGWVPLYMAAGHTMGFAIEADLR